MSGHYECRVRPSEPSCATCCRLSRTAACGHVVTRCELEQLHCCGPQRPRRVHARRQQLEHRKGAHRPHQLLREGGLDQSYFFLICSDRSYFCLNIRLNICLIFSQRRSRCRKHYCTAPQDRGNPSNERACTRALPVRKAQTKNPEEAGENRVARGVEEGRWGGAETEERKQHLCRSEPSEPSINTFAGSRRAGEYRASLSRSPDKVWFICMLRLGEMRSTRPNNVFGRPLPATK